MKQDSAAVLTCVGAVIGAGFASGREIIVFFTQYGTHGIWLIVLSAMVMAGLCFLCMRAAGNAADLQWCNLMRKQPVLQWSMLALLVITAGAMISAAGHMIALLWHHDRAYAVGAVGTLLAAWWMGFGSLKPLGLLGAVLTMALLCALMAALLHEPKQIIPLSGNVENQVAFIDAVLRATGYAGMNMALANGVVWRCAKETRHAGRVAGMFGWLIGVLLMLGHCVYQRFPEVHTSEFPIIALLSAYGRSSYLFSIALLYLSIITTLTSVLYALRTAVEGYTEHWGVQVMLCLGLPLAISCIGFAGIIDRFYAPAGWLCLLIVFLPMFIAQNKTARR